VRDLEIKEMPIEERYDKLLDDFLLDTATYYSIFKELGAEDKVIDLSVKVQKKMLPSILGGPVFSLLKILAPGRTFKQLSDTFMYTAQTWHPLSTLEVTDVSDRELILEVKNCVLLKRLRDIVNKTGLDIDPKFFCEKDVKYFSTLFKDYGVDVTINLEENGCKFLAKMT
jgi:hypothetical protein